MCPSLGLSLLWSLKWPDDKLTSLHVLSCVNSAAGYGESSLGAGHACGGWGKGRTGAETGLSGSLCCGLGMVKWYRTGRSRSSTWKAECLRELVPKPFLTVCLPCRTQEPPGCGITPQPTLADPQHSRLELQQEPCPATEEPSER